MKTFTVNIGGMETEVTNVPAPSLQSLIDWRRERHAENQIFWATKDGEEFKATERGARAFASHLKGD